MSARRTNGGLGPNPLTYAEIQAWAALTRRTLESWEVTLLCRLDDAMLAEMRKPESKKGTEP